MNSGKNQFKPLDVVTVPLDGVNLIEASAGTGKTFTISNLFLRLILESDLGVGNILVVTFTEAATKELKERIRNNLCDAVLYIADPASCDNEIIKDILENCFNTNVSRKVSPGDCNHGRSKVVAADENDHAPAMPVTRQTAFKKLKRAIISFDEASIFTIHGFCKRILGENSFESSILFNLELIKDQSTMIAEICDDFWRKNFIDGDLLPWVVLKKNSLDLKAFYAFSKNICLKSFLKIIPDAGDPCDETLMASFNALKDEWEGSKDEIKELLCNDPGLSRSAKAYRADKLDQYIKDLESVFNVVPNEKALKSVSMFASATLEKNMKKNKIAPEHSFFKLCDQFLENEKKYIIYIKQKFALFLKKELKSRKIDNNLQSFDDLLISLNEALQSENGRALAGAVTEKFKAALIDEFQDTDPVQYEIFSTLFKGSDTSLFMIGDPKQSIYGFRGADIFSYIEASNDVRGKKKYTLDTNYRSETGLVEAVNKLFSFPENPFVLGDAIAYNSVTASSDSGGNKNRLKIKGEKDCSLFIWYLKKENPTSRSKNPSKQEALHDSANAVVYEISQLLSLSCKGDAKLGEKKIVPSDIAILVTRNQDASLFKDKLGTFNIPAVVTKADNIFQTEEAREIELFLSAVSTPGHAKRLNGALLSSMVGCSGNEIFEFIHDDEKLPEYEAHIENFSVYHELWEKHGFMQMFRKFLSDYDVRQRFLNLSSGERRITNLLHLSELIHTAEKENNYGINGVLSYIAEQINSEEIKEEQELRLERDDEAVQICTVFKSKGLQYPIVFCPFMWQRTADVRDDDPVFHKDKSLFCDIGSDDKEENQKRAAMENLSELVRLLYVAVTRAKNRCYLTFGKIGTSGAGSLEYLLTKGGKFSGNGVVPFLKKKIKALDEDQLLKMVTDFSNYSNSFSDSDDVSGRQDGFSHGLDDIIKDPGDLVFVSEYKKEPGIFYNPVNEKEIKYSVRSFKHDIVQNWKIASFSMLTAGKRSDFFAFDETMVKKDESESFNSVPDFKDESDSLGSVFDFPGGVVTGLCIHNIFEHLDFSLKNVDANKKLIKSSLVRYGLDGEEDGEKRVYKMVSDVINSPLMENDSLFKLNGLKKENMLSELEFYYPVKHISSLKLKDVFAKHGKKAFFHGTEFVEKTGRLEFKPMQGFMMGFIDLIFSYNGKYYIVDWKTNNLGSGYEQYTIDNLKLSMVSSLYNLQYYIYSVALHKYLKERIKDYDYSTHFGGVFYLYIRGISPDKPGCGVFYDLPEKELMEDLCNLFG
ncbi:MAG: UvrD-helicase domain-containing protein [Thermodesulfobacteriota bacterium]|nr:UvrD-helicase domain-containing protein [Thermodesulfobacteriota bacterium]